MGTGAGAPLRGRSRWLPVSVLWTALLLPYQGSAQQAAPLYDVVALRVEFQPDTTRFTTGTGTFADPLFLADLEPSVDPLPHDAAYFRAHLSFLEHYVAKVSDGRTQVRTHLLPDVVRLGREMGHYSPTGPEANSDDERRKLVRLLEEAWSAASAAAAFDVAGLDPGRTAFIIFHAGVGRDVELLGTILDKTPLDLPSVFFSAGELRRLGAADIRFKGIPVGTTSLIPRTESRQGVNPLSDEPVLLELSINGLLAASFLNYLGAPDLFNTETGESAIGPFGLMDPQGIFAYSGLFPPEPSAWTRAYLGWLDTEVVRGAEPRTLELVAAGLQGSSAARVEISQAEYFLVENRNRDPEGDGLVLQIWQHGGTIEQRFEGVTDDFGPFNVDAFAGGVVTAVDNYDFALPGRDADDRQFMGGALVWHIDERRMADGTFNSDPGYRAVDLEEADSAQELGTEDYFGSPFDFFFEGNDTQVQLPSGTLIRLYENRFAADTTPNSRTNADGGSFIVLEQFSGPAPVMTVAYRREVVDGLAAEAVYDLAQATTGAGSAVLAGPHGMYAYAAASQRVFARSGDGRISHAPAAGKPVVTETGIAVIQRRGTGHVLSSYGIERGMLALGSALELPVAELEFRGPLVRIGRSYHALFAGGSTSVVVSVDETAAVTPVTDIGEVLGLAGDAEAIVVGRRGSRSLSGDAAWHYELDGQAKPGQAVFGRDRRGLWGVLPVPDRRTIMVLKPDGTVTERDVGVYADDSRPLSGFPVLADISGDGLLEIIVMVGEELMALHDSGALVEGYPVHVGAQSLAQPLVFELAESGRPGILVAGHNGEVYAFEGDRLLDGFPLQAGASIEASPYLAEGSLAVLSTSGQLRQYRADDVGAALWGELYGSGTNGSVAAAADVPFPFTAPVLIVDAETYNWPNPIREGQSFVRCMTSEDAEVRISIVDAAGTLVDELDLSLRAGRPGEVLWQTRAASGLYYARVRARAASGRTESKLIRMAVIR